MTEEKEVVSETEAELKALLEERRRQELISKRIADLQGKVNAEKKAGEADRMRLINAEAYRLRKEGLGSTSAYLRCWKCQKELKIEGVRQVIGESGSWVIALDAVCPVCSSLVLYEHPENLRYCKVVSYDLIKENKSNYYDMRC